MHILKNVHNVLCVIYFHEIYGNIVFNLFTSLLRLLIWISFIGQVHEKIKCHLIFLLLFILIFSAAPVLCTSACRFSEYVAAIF